MNTKGLNSALYVDNFIDDHGVDAMSSIKSLNVRYDCLPQIVVH